MLELALNGGNPVREELLPYGKQSINQDDIEAVVEALKSDFLTTGPKVKEFEKAIAQYVGSKYAVAFSNGTTALHAAAFVSGLKEGDEAIVSSITFAASANCVRYCGAMPVFADVNPENLNIDINKLEDLLNSKTKVVIAVDYTGQPVDIDKISQFCKENNLVFIEDAAHALGSKYRGNRVGSQADMTMFSFHPVKPITTGEGGIITTNSDEYYNKLVLFRSHGITRNPDLLKNNDGPWYYEQQVLGHNFRLTDLQSALGISQLKRIQQFLFRRREIAEKYNKEFSKINEIIITSEAEYSESGHHIYVIRIKPELLQADRKTIFEALQAENIGVNVHYLPVYLLPYYQQLGYKKGLCPNAEEAYENMITLPLFPEMTDQDVTDVITAVKKVIGYYQIESKDSESHEE